MRLRVVDFRAFYAGLVFAAAGAAAFILAHQYDIGTALDMGPGFFPALIGVVLFVIGLISAAQGLWATDYNPVDRRALLPISRVLAGVASFALLIERMGLLVALLALLFLSCFDRLRSRPIEFAVIYLLIAGFSAGLFIYAFHMPIKLGWWR